MSEVTRMMASVSASITTFMADPSAVLKQSQGQVVAVTKSCWR